MKFVLIVHDPGDEERHIVSSTYVVGPFDTEKEAKEHATAIEVILGNFTTEIAEFQAPLYFRP